MKKTNSLKRCSVCQVYKSATTNFFGVDNRHIDGLESRCKTCRKEWSKKYYTSNKNRLLIQSQKYYKNNLTKSRLLRSKYYLKNKDEILAKSRALAKTEIGRKKSNEKVKRLYHSNVNYKLIHLLRARLRVAIYKNYKVGSAVKDLGCSILELRIHLESKFQDGMNWNNWGKYGWHIDHIRPLASFDLTDKEQFKEACHYTNLQPMWAKDNLSKGSKLLKL